MLSHLPIVLSVVNHNSLVLERRREELAVAAVLPDVRPVVLLVHQLAGLYRMVAKSLRT